MLRRMALWLRYRLSRRERRGARPEARIVLFLVLLGIGLAVGGTAGAEELIDFEQFTGPSVFNGIDPPLTVGVATFSGGQVLNAATFLPADPTVVYGTAFFCPGCLPTLTIDFSVPVSDFSMLVLNGQTFVVTYFLQDDQGGTDSVTLDANFNGGAGVVSLPSSGIQQVTLTSSTGSWDFLIDEVRFTPEEEFDISFSSFIPANNVIGPPQSRCGFPPTNRLYFEGDDRSFDPDATSFRTRQLVTVIPNEATDSDGLKEGSDQNLVGETRAYAPDALADGTIDASDDDGTLGDCTLLHDTGTASTGDMEIEVTRLGPDRVQVHLFGGAGNPLVFGAPDIDWDFTIEIDTSQDPPQWTLTGSHDGFPAYEIYINGQTIYTYSPGTPPFDFGDLRALFPPLDVDADDSGQLGQ